MNNAKQIRPIHFSRLEVGSTFDIFSEPTRGIRKSSDRTVWRKDAESYSTDTQNEERCAILYPEDLVRPLSRPNTRSK